MNTLPNNIGQFDTINENTGEYEFCPNLADMVFDIINNAESDPNIGFASLADMVRDEINSILGWKENVAIEGGGRIFIAVPKFLVEGASRLG